MSSPLGSEDHHAELFERGDTAFQQVACAASWEANPTITEEHTHTIQPDARIWRREFAAIPQAGVLAAFDADAIERAFTLRTGYSSAGRAIVIDASSGRKDTFAWGVVGWGARTNDVAPTLFLERVTGLEGAFWKSTTGAQIAREARELYIEQLHGDQRESLMLTPAFRGHGQRYVAHDWTSASKPLAIEKLRRLFAEGRIALPVGHEKLRRELLSFEERITSTGAFTFGARGSGHDDYVALLITAMMADEKHGIPYPGRRAASFAASVAPRRGSHTGSADDDTPAAKARRGCFDTVR